jgi:hypothetical protein
LYFKIVDCYNYKVEMGKLGEFCIYLIWEELKK